jgi:hypothetical protein
MIFDGKIRKQEWVAAGLLILALALFAPTAAEKSAEKKSDFPRYYTAGCVARAGGDIYEPGSTREFQYLQFKYLPVFAQIMIPFSFFPVAVAAYLWYVLLAVSYLGLLAVTLAWARPSPRHRLWVAALAVALTARFFVDNARLGQINLPVAFLAVWGAYLVFQGRERTGGMVTALAAAVKYMPLLLILFYAWKRRWWAASYGIIGLFVLFLYAPALTWGGGNGRALLQEWIQNRHKMVTSLPESNAPGQSVPALLNRFLRPVPASGANDPRVNILDLRIALVNQLALAAVIILIAITAWLTRRIRKSDEEGLAGMMEVSLVLILMLFVSPESRSPHFVTLLMPAVLLGAWSLSGPGGRIRKGPLALLCFAILIMYGTATDLIGERANDYVSAYGAMALLAALLAAGCLIVRQELAASAPPVSGESAHGQSAAP